MKTHILLVALLLVPSIVIAECAEFKVIDHGDRMEAVCIGEPLTEIEKYEIERQKAQEQVNAQKLKADQEREDVRQKLAKVECTGIPGECGPGRVCFTLISAFVTRGTCKEKDDANRALDRINDRQRDNARETAQNFKDMQRESDRQFKERQREQQDLQRDQKIDRIDRKLRYGGFY